MQAGERGRGRERDRERETLNLWFGEGVAFEGHR